MKRLFCFYLAVVICFGCFCSVSFNQALSAFATNELGDVNADGYIDNVDAVRILMYDACLIDFNEDELLLADVNDDGSADNLDAVLILMYDAGINDTVSGKAPSLQECSHANLSIINASASSCAAYGYTGDTYCNDCNTIVEYGANTPKTVHDGYIIVNRVDATVDADGYSGDEYCPTCQCVVKQGIALERFTGISTPVTYLTYTKSNGQTLTLPQGVDILEYTLKRANKSAVSEYPEIEAEILRLINIEREKQGIAPLKNQPGAYYYSNIRAVECIESFSHTRPDGTGCFTVFNDGDVFYRRAGENLFYCSGYPLSSVAETSVEGWMNSDGHRANILNPDFTSTTIGVVYIQETKTFYAVQLFMS